MLKKLKQADYRVSSWSGGTTTQLAIWPPEAVYAERDFLWRISSATVELELSDFTPLPDYERLIATLEGEIVLTHNGGAPLTLRPWEVHAFSGADATRSVGRCRDFNLMLRRGRAEGRMEALCLEGEPLVLPAGPAREQSLLFCAAGSCAIDAPGKRVSLLPGESLLLMEPLPLTLTGPAKLMLCRMRILCDPVSGPAGAQ
jgi:environmental stress-induced protein Ves